jgi:hypothetical protein
MARKTEVYTWRVSAALKAGLEDAARNADRSVADLLDEIVAEHLSSRNPDIAEREQQQRLHARAARFAGVLAGQDPNRSSTVRSRVRARLRKQRSSVR